MAGWRRMAVAAILGAAVATAASLATAQDDGPDVEVVYVDRVSPLINDGGDVRTVSIQSGEWAHFGEFSLEPGSEYTRSSHSSEEYIYVLSGTAVVAVEDSRYVVGPRTGLYLPPGADATWTNGSDRFVAVQFEVGPSAGKRYDEWNIDDGQEVWPRPRRMPRPAPSEVSKR